MMEITWGDFHFICQDKTAALLLAAAPLVFILQLPYVLRAITNAVNLVLGRKSSLEQDIKNRIEEEESRSG